MTDNPAADQQQQAKPQPDKPKAATMPTAAELDALAEAERSSFMNPTELSARRQAETAATLEGKKPDADNDPAVLDPDAEAAKKKPEARADDKKADAAPALPAGISQADLQEATGNIANVLTKEQAADLADSKKVPNLTAAVVVHLGDQNKERTRDMVDFITKSPKTMAAIAALPPIKQAGAFERAFTDRPKSKTVSDASAPLDRVNTMSPGLGGETFSEYEARRNAEDIAERMH
jgi:hypothetical protein